MKKQMKMAAMLTSAVLLCGAVPVTPVSALESECAWFGETDQNAFQDAVPLDDKGMLNICGTAQAYQTYMQEFTDWFETEETDAETGAVTRKKHYYPGYRLYTVTPKTDTLRFVLRSDAPEAAQEMYEILDKFYPERGGGQVYFECLHGTVYELTDKTEHAGSDTLADSLMHDLDNAGLISEFYTWGQTAVYRLVSGGLEMPRYIGEDFDWKQVQAYLDAHALNCAVAGLNYDMPAGSPDLGTVWTIKPNGEMSFAEKFTAAAEIYEAFGYRPEFEYPAETFEAVGKNALASVGDLNLDGKTTVSDAVLLARILAEDSTVSVAPEGMRNADMNASGTPDQDDLILLLKKLAGIRK